MSLVRKILVTSSVVVVLMVVVGTLAARVAQPKGSVLEDLKVFSETLLLVTRNYVEPVDQDLLERGAFQGLAESLDPWSSYYDPAHAGKLMQRDRKGDVGLLLLKQPQQYARIVVVVPGSPADAAGLARGEFIETIDGVATRDLTLLESALMLQGEPGTTVQLGFFPETEDGDRRKVDVIRKDLASLRATTEVAEPGIAVLRVTDVRPGIAELVAARLRELAASGITRLVIDLRANTGGAWEEVVGVADLFVGARPLFQRRTAEATAVAEAKAGSEWPAAPVVLVGRATVGEAEVLAHALRAGGASVLVGQSTFGKYTGQDLVLLEDGAGLYMSVAEYRQADGSPFAKEGIEPDEVVVRSQPGGAAQDTDFGAVTGEEAVEAVDDAATPRADAEPAPAVTPPATSDVDHQLERAIEILKGAQVKKAA